MRHFDFDEWINARMRSPFGCGLFVGAVLTLLLLFVLALVLP